MSLTVAQIQAAYVVFFNRPADPAGLTFWQSWSTQPGNDLANLHRAFALSPEYASHFANLTPDQQVALVYRNLLGREPDLGGLNYWSNELATGRVTVATLAHTIAVAAQNPITHADPAIQALANQDRVTVLNRVTAATSFTNALDTAAERLAYDGIEAFAAARDWLGTVNHSTPPASLRGAPIDAVVFAVITDRQADAGRGQTFTLTENVSVSVVVTPDVLRDITPIVRTVTYIGLGVQGSDGIPLYDLDANLNPVLPGSTTPVAQMGFFSYIRDLVGLDFVQLGLINVAHGIDGGGQVNAEQLARLADSVVIGAITGDTNTVTVTVTAADGTVHTSEVDINNAYFNLLTSLIFNEASNLRLFERVVEIFPRVPITVNDVTFEQAITQFVAEQGTTTTTRTEVPIILTPTVNNGGSRTDAGEDFNPGLRSDLIIAPRLELLHQAYIDGGTGLANTLEVDTKGFYAQPAALLNIQHIKVNNLPNVYDQDGELNSIPVLQSSTLDLSRAVDIQTLTITESAFDGLLANRQPGSLTVSGIRNGAETTLDGSFTQSVFLHFGSLQGAGVDLVLNNVNFGAMGAGTNPLLVVAHNSPALNILSTGGGNFIANGNLVGGAGQAGGLTTLNIGGNAHLYIEGDLNPSFHNATPVTINAADNTGGVNLTLSGSQNVTFTGSRGNDRFSVTTADTDVNPLNDETVVINGGAGNNYYEVIGADQVSITNGDGNNNYEILRGTPPGTSTDLVTITAGNGANHFEIAQVATAVLTVGNGNNRFDITSNNSFDYLVPDSVEFKSHVTILAGNGRNDIDVAADPNIGEVRVTVGNGGNAVNVEAATISVTAGTGADHIRVEGRDITVNAAGSSNRITVIGTDNDYTDTASGALLRITAGSNSMLTLGSGNDPQSTALDNFPGTGSLTAKDGSFITGTNLTLFVDTVADLRAATLTGITRIILDDDNLNYANSNPANTNVDQALLTLTSAQMSQLVAGGVNISVDGGIFNTSADIKIIVTSNLNVTTGPWATFMANLPASVDLQFEINDGATLTITAQQLHTRVSEGGISIANDGNSDHASGRVHITRAGTGFDPFNNLDSVRTVIDGRPLQGGSLATGPFGFATDGPDLNSTIQRSEWGQNVLIDRTLNGYNRPADAPSFSRLTIDTDEQLGQVGPFATIETFLRIVGDSDMEFTPIRGGIDEWGAPITGGTAIRLGVDQNLPANEFTVDFSAATGEISNLTLAHFQNAQAVYGNGSAQAPARVNVQIDDGGAANSVTDGAVGSSTAGLISRGVQTYVVTDITGARFAGNVLQETGVNREGNAVQFWTCVTTEGLQTLGLRGNLGDTITFGNVEHGVNFLMEVAYDKFDGYAVGTVVADFARPGADAVFNVVGLQPLPAGEVQVVAGINVIDADTLTLNVSGGNTRIVSLEGADVENLVLSANANLNIVTPLMDAVTSVNASAVTGTLTMRITDPAEGLDFVGARGATNLTLDNATEGEIDSISGVGAIRLTIGDDATPANTVNLTDTVLSNVASVTLLGHSTLTLTMAQAAAIGAANFAVAAGDTASLVLEGLSNQVFALANYDVDGTINITLTLAALPQVTLNPLTNLSGINGLVIPDGTTLHLTAAQFQQLNNTGSLTGGAGANVVITNLTQADVAAGFSLAGVAIGGTITLTLAESVDLSGATIDLAGVDTFNIGGFTLTLGDVQVADGVAVNGTSGSVLRFTDTTSGPFQSIDASGFTVDRLMMLNVLVSNRNIDLLFSGLPESVTKVIYSGLGQVEGVVQNVVITAGTTVPGFVVFNPNEADTEIRFFNLTMEGGAEISGNLRLSAWDDQEGLLQADLQTVTINSRGTAVNAFSGNTANIIDGDITSQGIGAISVDNDLLNVIINAEQNFVVDGRIVFESVVGNDNIVVNDDPEATAALTVNGSANVTIGQLDISDADIDTLVVTNNGSGTLTVTGASPAILTADEAEPAETQNLVLQGTGDMVFGDAIAATDRVGIDSTSLVSIDASGLSGDLNLGEIAGLNAAAFSFQSGTGLTRLTLTAGAELDSLGTDGFAETADDTAGWSFDFTGAAAGSQLRIFGNALAAADPGSTLSINMGAHGVLFIDGAPGSAVNLAGLNLDIASMQSIVLADRVTLTLTAAQADGLNIIAGPDTGAAGITARVNVIHLDNAPVDLSGIAANIAGTTTLIDDDVTLAATTDLGNFSITLDTIADDSSTMQGQTIRFQNVEQAERRVIAADDATPQTGSSTNVVWLFDSVTAPVDTSGYGANLGRLWISQTLADGANVEGLFTTLPATIVRVEFSSIEFLDAVLTSADVNRVVELVAHTSLPAGLVFSDADRLEHLNTLTLNLGGEVNVGSLNLDNLVVPAANVGGISFDRLTINSHRALHQDHLLAPELYVNDNDGANEAGEHVAPANLNVIGNIGIGGNNGLDLLNVELNTGTVSTVGIGLPGSQGANLQIGTITFDAETAGSDALLTVTGNNATTIASLDVTDAQIDQLTIDHWGAGTLSVTGASPAAALGSAAAVANVETLIINANTATGVVLLGTANNPTRPGVSGDDLSLIEVNGTGNVNLGLIALVDGAAPVAPATRSFYLDATDSSGTVTATLGGSAALAAGGVWEFDNGTAGTLALTITDQVTLGAGRLTIGNAAVTIQGHVDFTTLTLDNPLTGTDEEGLVLTGTTTIHVPAGSTLRILAEDASGRTITGAGAVTIEDLELVPNADFSRVMTNQGDSGTVFTTVNTADGADADALPDLVNLTGNLGIAQVTVTGNGVANATGATMDATIDRDPTTGVNNERVMATFVVQAAATLVLTAAQGDDRSVTGAGTTNVQDIGLYAGTNVMSLAGIVTAQVNIAVDSSVILDRLDSLGAAGAGRVTTIAPTATLTAAGSVVDGQHITSNSATLAGTNATLVVDDQNDGVSPIPDTPITANLSNVSVEFIRLAPTALVGTITWPALTGNPADKYVDDSATVTVNDPNPNVFVQTVTLTAAQASGQVIVGATPGVTGEVAVTALGADLTNLSLINAGRMIANVPLDAALHASTNLGHFDLSLSTNADLTLSAAQANGRDVFDLIPADTSTSVTVTALEATPNADLSRVVVSELRADADERAGIDLTQANVTFTGNLGAGFTVTVTDADAPADSTLSFAGSMVSAQTAFDLADSVTLVLDAAHANGLTVTDDATNTGAANTTVIVNNLGAAQVSFVNISGNTLIANVASDVTLHTGTVIDTGSVTQGYTGVTVVTTDGSPTAAEQAAFTLTTSMTRGESVTINGLTVAADPNALASSFNAAAVASVFGGATVAGLTLSGASGTPTGWIGAATVSVAGAVVTFSNTVPGNVANFSTWTGSVETTNNFRVVLAEGVDLGLSTTQLLNIDEADFVGTAGGVTETLIVNHWNGEPIRSDELGADVLISRLNVAAGTVFATNHVTANAAADFTRVQEIVIPLHTTLTLSADQYQQLLGNAGNVTVSGAGTLHIVGFDDQAPTSNAAIDLSRVTAQAGSISLSTDAIVIVDPAARLDNASGQKFAILFNATASTQSLTLSSESQADGRTITGVAAHDNQLVLGFTHADATDANAIIEAGGYSNLDRLYVINRFVENEFGIAVPVGPIGNVERFLNDLASGTTVVITDVDTILAAQLSAPGFLTDLTFRAVRVERETSVTSDLAFSDLNPAQEVSTLVLSLEGNSVINGNLALPQNKDPQVLLAATNRLPNLFDTLTINSSNVLLNGITAGPPTAENRINGNITADSVAGTPDSVVESFTYTITAPAGGVVGTEEQISFNGVVLTLGHGQTAAQIATALAALVNGNAASAWTGVAVGNVITFSNRDVGNLLTDVNNASFTYTQNNPANATLGGVVGAYVQGSFVGEENNLFDVTINAQHALTIAGTIEMRYVARSLHTNDPTVDATLNVHGNAAVTIGAVNNDDADTAALLINHTGTGTLAILGTSPGASVQSDETLTIRTNGTLTLGTPADPTRPGVAGAALSSLLVQDAVPPAPAVLNPARSVNLGVITDVDSALFTMDTSDFGGTVRAIVTDDLNLGGTWSFIGGQPVLNGPSAGNLYLTFRGDVGATDGMDLGDEAQPASGTSLTLTNVNLTIEGQISFADLTATLTNVSIVVAAGSTLTLTCDQAHNLRVSGDGTLILVGDVDNDMNFNLLNVSNIDMSQIVNTDGSPLADSDVVVTMGLGAFTRNFNIIGSNFSDAISTGSGADTLSGGLGNDTLSSGTGADSIAGGAGDDILEGGSGNDTILGDAGNDTIRGADNNDTIDGGTGTDTLTLTASYAPVLDANLEGVENVVLGVGALVLNLANQAGEAFNVTVTGTAGTTITTADGNDSITGGAGNDTITAGLGNDSITGGDGTDSINGGDGNDSIDGGVGNDADRLIGGAGNDTLVGAQGDALLDGGLGADVLQIGADFTNTSDEQIVGIETVNLTAAGLSVNLDAQDEALLINAFANAALVTGMAMQGTDTSQESSTYTLNALTAGQSITIAGLTVTATTDATAAQVADAFRGTATTGVVAAASGTLDVPADWAAATTLGGTGATLTFTNNANGDVTDLTASSTLGSGITGGAGNDTIIGGNGNDSLTGGEGLDSIVAGAGNDTLVGAQDDALLDGGTGTDTLRLDAAFNDVSNEQIVNIENVTLTAGGVFTFDQQTEGLNITGFNAASTITGGLGADSITGGTANDVINGGAGNDTINGGLGADVLQIGASFTSTSDAQIAGIETVNLTADGLTVSMGNQEEALTINGFATGASTITGGTGADSITGGTGNDSLTGGAGNDSLIGGLGNDTLVGAQDNALLDGGAGADVLQIGADFTSTGNAQIANIETVNLTVTGLTVSMDHQTEALTINGFATGASTITGGTGADSITGGTGNDTIVVGAGDTGAETLAGGLGTDTLRVASTLEIADTAVVSGFEAISLAEGANLTIAATELGDNTIATVTGTQTTSGPVETVTFSGTASADTINLSGITTVSHATLVVQAGVDNDAIVGSAFADSIDGGDGSDNITGGGGNDTLIGGADSDIITGGAGDDSLSGGAGSDTFIFVVDATAETDTITDWGVGGNNDAVSGELGAGDRLIVNMSPWVGGTGTAQPTATPATAGANGVVPFASTYRVGDVVTITFNGTHSVSRTVQAGATSGVDVAQAFQSVFASLTMSTSFDLDLVDGVGAATVSAAIDGSATLFIVNDVGDDGAFGLTAAVAGATGYVFDASVIAAANGVVSVTGNTGNDTITGGIGNDTLNGAEGNDILTGGTGNDILNGGAGNDILNGGAGNDILNGGLGNDSLTLGAGNDVLVFTNHGVANADTISDYVVADDRIELSLEAFVGLTGTAGSTLAASAFLSGAGATGGADADDRIIYNTTDGTLWFDADGNTASGVVAVLIGTFTGNPALVAAEFTIIA